MGGLLVATLLLFVKDEIKGLIGVTVTCLTWTCCKVLGEAIESLAFLSKDD